MSTEFSDLYARHAVLARELVAVNRKLTRVAARLSATAGRSSGTRAPGAGARNGQRANGAAERQAWFERGEALTLMQDIARKPMHQADLVRALSAKKGYDKKLSAAAHKKFAGAAFQAIANAVVRRKLVVAKDGTVLARTGA